MNDRTLPLWLRLTMAGMALMQLFFGITLLLNPGGLTSLWPWPMTTITTRLLGASTLVSVPLALLSVYFNRFSAARLPMIMILAYRVLQIAAGLAHLERFDFTASTTWNYFGGGAFMLVVLALGVVKGRSFGQPVTESPRWLRGKASLELGKGGEMAFHIIGVFFFILGVAFFIQGEKAAWLWFEAEGNLTGLTARLFSSPMIGLGLAAWIIASSKRWREVGIPGAGMATFGVAGTLTMIVDSGFIQPPTFMGYLVVMAPLLLLGMGVFLLMPGRAKV